MVSSLSTISWMNVGTSRAGDQSPGIGLSTGNQTSEGAVDRAHDVGMPVLQQLDGTTAGHPVSWWIALVAILIAIKYFAEWGQEGAQFANIRIGFFNVMVITLAAIVGLVFLKWVFGMYRVPGVSAIILAA